MQENNKNEADNTEPTLHGNTQDLPEFLQTAPIPVSAQETHTPQEENPRAHNSGDETEIIPQVDASLASAATMTSLPNNPSEETENVGQEEEEMNPASSKRKKRGLVIGAFAVVLLVGAYCGVAWYFADRVPADTTVAGVDVSNMTKEEALTTLETELHEVITADIEVALGESESALDPDAAGLSVDLERTVDSLVDFSLNPASVFAHLFGQGAYDLKVEVETEHLHAALEALEEDLNLAPVEGELAIVDGEVEKVDPKNGLALDIEAAAPVIEEEWLHGQRPIQLPETTVVPTMDAKAIEQTEKDIIDPLFSGDIAVVVDDEETEIPQDVVAQTASLHALEGEYELRIHSDELEEKVHDLLPELGESPQDAEFEFRNGKPRIIPSKSGSGVDMEELAEKISQAALKTGDERKVEVDLTTTEPDFTTDDAEELGIKEKVAHFSTPVPYDPERTKNLVNGAKKLTGVLVKPGETFSLIEALGPIDGAHGYVESGVVVNGFADTAMGGGLSQMSTTMFNAAFEAGMEDVTHTPHSRYFDRYPEGREATMFAPSLDMKWRNNTSYGVLVQSWIDDEAHVVLWSTKYWDTDITTGPRTGVTPPKTVYNNNPGCKPESGGISGFTVTVDRVVSKDGKRNDQYSGSYTHTYQPWNKVVCGEKPSD